MHFALCPYVIEKSNTTAYCGRQRETNVSQTKKIYDTLKLSAALNYNVSFVVYVRTISKESKLPKVIKRIGIFIYPNRI